MDMFPSKVASEFILTEPFFLKLEWPLKALWYFGAPPLVLGEARFIFRYVNCLAFHPQRI